MTSRPLPKTIQALVAKHPDKFEEGWTEDDGFAGDDRWSHWVYLKRGWCYPESGAHIIHESSVREVKEAWRFIQPCDCDDCKHGYKPPDFSAL